MAESVCAVEGCVLPMGFADGLCASHHYLAINDASGDVPVRVGDYFTADAPVRGGLLGSVIRCTRKGCGQLLPPVHTWGQAQMIMREHLILEHPYRSDLLPRIQRLPKPPCIIGGCGRKQYGFGYCRVHRQRVRETGDPQAHIPIAPRTKRKSAQ